MRLTRYSMYKQIEQGLPGPISGKVLSISGLEGMRHLLDEARCEVTDASYPEVDIHHLPYPDETFDWVISDQVLEHIENPDSGIAESWRVLKKGGIAIHTTCFVNYYHPAPIDYWRFSPDALRFLCARFSEILQCGGWGNRLAILLCFLGDRFRAMEIPEHRYSPRRWVATLHEPRYPISTWIIARK
jgi:SAM-dependent methyltransferase